MSDLGAVRDGLFVPYPTVVAETPERRYRFLVEDIVSQRLIGRLPLNGAVLEDALNRPGALRATLPADHPLATVEMLDEGRRAIYVERDGRILWGGPLWQVNRPLGGRTLQLTCGGWLGYWDHRQIWLSHLFTNTEQFTIFKSLVDDAQDTTALGAGADLGIDVEWSAASGVLRTRTEYLDHKAKNLGEALRQLAAVENGFDFAMTYALDSVNDRITKRIRLHYPQKGRDTGFLFQFQGGRSVDRYQLTSWADELGVWDEDLAAWGTEPHAGSGLRSNITRWGVVRDAEQMAWRVRGWGAGLEEDRSSSTVVDESKRNVYPFLDADLSQFTSDEVQATLDANVVEAAARLGHSQHLPVVEVDPDMQPQFGAWEMGDTVRLRIDDGYGSIAPRVTDTPPSVRIIGYRLDCKTDRPALALQEV